MAHDESAGRGPEPRAVTSSGWVASGYEPPVRKTSPADEALSTLDSRLTALEKGLYELEVRLVPVLAEPETRPEDETALDKKAAKPRLVGQMRQLADRLSVLERAVASMTERLEV